MTYKIKVNNKILSSDNRNITGLQILELADFSPVGDYDLYKKIEGKEFEPIQIEEQVDLAEPGIERFKVKYRKKIVFNVDDEDYSTMETELTPIDIFETINIDPLKYYLKQIKGHLEITYKNDTNKEIDMIGSLKFITCINEPTPVS